MNKFGTFSLGAALLAIASACNQAPDDNQASEGANAQPASNETQMTNDVLQDDPELATPQEPEANSGAAVQPARNTASESRPEAGADDTRRPPPKAASRAEPDPHAGHDMGNMANMSQD